MTPADVQALRDEIDALLADIPDDTGIWMGHSLCLQIRDALLSVRPDAQALEALRDEMRVYADVPWPIEAFQRDLHRFADTLDVLLHGAGRLHDQEKKGDLLSDMRQHIQHRWIAQPDKIEDWYDAIQRLARMDTMGGGTDSPTASTD